MNLKYHHIHLVCSDLEQSIHFFGDVMGATLIGRKKFGTADGAMLELAGTNIFLRVKGIDEKIVADSTSARYGYDHLAFETDDVDTVYAELTAKGYLFSVPPKSAGTNRVAFLKGPDNITIELITRFEK